VEKKVKFDSLSEDAIRQSMVSFIDFYLDRYLSNNLEILADYKVDYYLNDINHFIFQNQSLTPNQLREELFRRCYSEIRNVITVIDPEYFSNGNLVSGSWEGWYEQKFAKIPVRD